MNRFRTLAHRCDRVHLSDENLLSAIVRISREPEVLWKRQGRSLIRIRPPIKLRLVHDNAMALERIVSDLLKNVTSLSLCIGSSVFAQLGLWSVKLQLVGNAVAMEFTPKQSKERSAFKSQPISLTSESKPLGHEDCALHNMSVGTKHDIVSLAMKLLFECEFRVLVEFLESIVPIIYAMYVAIMSQLSSAQYYPETSGKSATQIETMVLNITLYASMEAFSFLCMQLWVQWKSSLSATHVLAFVIENQTQELSGRLFVWCISLLQFTLVHFGMLVLSLAFTI